MIIGCDFILVSSIKELTFTQKPNHPRPAFDGFPDTARSVPLEPFLAPSLRNQMIAQTSFSFVRHSSNSSSIGTCLPG